jgi:hypothetical protein
LPRVGHRHGRFPDALPYAYEARDPDAVMGSLVDRHERLVVAVIDVRQIAELRVGQACDRREETQVARLRAELLEARGERVSVARTQCPNADAPSFGELDPVSHREDASAIAQRLVRR